LSKSFPYITLAAYAPKSEGFENGEDYEGQEDQSKGGNEQEGGREPAPDLVINQAIQNEYDTESQDQEDQFMVPVVSAGSAALVIVALLATLAVRRNARRQSMWKEDAVKDAAESVDDLELDGFYDADAVSKKRRKKGMKKQQSLHMRDSLREMVESEGDEKSDASSSLVGRLLTSAAGVIPACAARDEGDANADDKANNSRGSGDTHSSSDVSEGKSDTHSKDGTFPSEFEGNAVVKPNLVPISDPDSFDDDVHEPLPPSRIASARRDEMPIRLTSIQRQEESPGNRATHAHESFLAKYWNPLSGNILPLGSYFSGTGYAKDENSKGDFTPRTPATDQDARWSDISSQNEDFELDKEWDPDDASFNSCEIDREIFSPTSTKLMLSDEDEVELLKAPAGTKYNLEKLRTPPAKARSAHYPHRTLK
jgi:hypothetical protein